MVSVLAKRHAAERIGPAAGLVRLVNNIAPFRAKPAVWASVAVFALTPMQDLLDLGTEARMNYPSRLGGNWEWWMEEGAMSEEVKVRVRELNLLYSR